VLAGAQGSLLIGGAGIRAVLTGDPGDVEEFRPG
jgi:hypothetical protein